MKLGRLLGKVLKAGYDTSAPTGKYGVVKNETARTVALTVGGAIAGGPAGAAAGAAIAGGINTAQAASDANKLAKEQLGMQAAQAKSLLNAQKLADARLADERKRVNTSLFRLSRGKVKGSLFGGFGGESTLGAPAGPGTTLG